jgi:hypothetical protein
MSRRRSGSDFGPSHPALNSFSPGGWLLTLLWLAGLAFPGTGVRAGGLNDIVKSFCLSAFESELAQAGKQAPAGMANYACGCVADQLSTGASLSNARQYCREATAQRYPI